MKLYLPFKWQNAEPRSERMTISLITEYMLFVLFDIDEEMQRTHLLYTNEEWRGGTRVRATVFTRRMTNQVERFAWGENLGQIWPKKSV